MIFSRRFAAIPAHRIHRRIDKLLFGREYPEVHRFLDSMASLGGKHRALPPHDVWSLMIYTQDPQRILSGIIHILTDSMESKAKAKRSRKIKL